MVNTLKILASDLSIIICKPDKGNGVVLLDRIDYNSKMLQILSDTTKFVPVVGDWLKILFKIEDKLNRFIDELFKKGVIAENVRTQLKSTGSKFGIMYGLPKVHKQNLPLRPILSTVGTANYSLSKFLVSLLSPLSQNEFTIKDTFCFVNEITNLPNMGYTMASFDVVSLFTNIPIDETIEIILNKIFTNGVTDYFGFDKNLLKKCLNLCTKDNVFIFNENLYNQKDGAPMGGCVSPTLANIFLAFHEQNWLDDCPASFKPALYRRYVDDTFLLFRSPNHVNQFLDYLNGQHPNIKFTSEIENNNSLNFLDVALTKLTNSFETSVFRKSTCTGLGMKFGSAVSFSYKVSLVSCLVDRAYKICSTFAKFSCELDNLRQYFCKNGYPIALVEKIFLKKINIIYSVKTSVPTVTKKIIYFVVPYLGDSNTIVKKQIRTLVQKFYPQLDLRIIFTNSFSMQSLFKVKDRMPTLMRSNVVYKYTCSQCQATYCGETTRHLQTRIAEHKGVSVRTGKPALTPANSKIRDHAISQDHPIVQNNFKIIGSTIKPDLKLLESILIHQSRPTLNDMSSSTPLSILG
jgi:hypothetical protein